jgi:hypothetical protein
MRKFEDSKLLRNYLKISTIISLIMLVYGFVSSGLVLISGTMPRGVFIVGLIKFIIALGLGLVGWVYNFYIMYQCWDLMNFWYILSLFSKPWIGLAYKRSLIEK